MTTASQVSKLYHTVVRDVINNVKESFLDEGVDEQVLQELKQLWESKLAASKALEPPPEKAEVLIAPSTAPMRMPQPLRTVTGNNTMDLAAAQAAVQQAQPVQETAAQVAQPAQYQPSAAAQAAAMSLPVGMFQRQMVGADGQIRQITVQQLPNGQYVTLPQLQQVRQQSQPVAIRPQPHQQVTQQITQQGGQQLRIQQPMLLQQQPQQLMHPGQTMQSMQGGNGPQGFSQLDGGEDTSSSEDDEDFDVDDKDEEDKEEENEEEREEEEPLNSADDVSEEDPTELFDTENVVVCQYDKINRNKNKWKFHLKDGIMSLDGRDYVFQKATGDAEW